ncbi:hypothetical protein EW081_23160 [Vibrio vulnificus]|nr:hypothetical protein [Vibrio vulnificus]EGR0880211.1 hypothetical protein [Vibrio vulnificus]MBH9747234.1 hypothetical protein [Vibrio vulnificus]MBH9767390.1 hypothetical protein [Vibrio vulnificus]MBH9775645.1 hypothetical protein [Vibrio vulnificus]
MSFINEWREMSMTKKITLVASVATILGLCISFYSTFASSKSTTVNQTINGNQNTTVGENSGTININVSDSASKEQRLVLRNSATGSSLVVSEPDVFAATDPSKHVCDAFAGTPVSLTGRTSNQNNMIMHEVLILSGACKGKKGWASASVLSYE